MITGRPVTIEAAFTAEAPHLMPLPGEAFDPARQLEARVDNRARVQDQHQTQAGELTITR